jgi:hypothetical protein
MIGFQIQPGSAILNRTMMIMEQMQHVALRGVGGMVVRLRRDLLLAP